MPTYPGSPLHSGYGPAKPTTTPDGVRLADLGIRFVAKVVDQLLLSMVVFALSWPFLIRFLRGLVDLIEQAARDAQNGTRTTVDPFAVYTETGMLPYVIVASVASIVVSGLYNVTLVHLKGATLGKMMLRVRVRPWDAEGLPTWSQAFKRWASGELVGLFVGLYTWIDYLWPTWDNRKQALHDKWPGTVVVSRT